MTTAGRSSTLVTVVQATRLVATAQAKIARRQPAGGDLGCERIFEDLPLLFDQALHPAPVAVVEQASGVVRRDDLGAAGADRTLRRCDRPLTEELGDQADLIAMLDVDQPGLAGKPAVPHGVRG